MNICVDSIEPYKLEIPFKFSFRHASAERSGTLTCWIVASAYGRHGFGEGCPRPYVTTEDLETASRFFKNYSAEWTRSIHDVKSLREWCEKHSSVIDANPAAWTAVEIALLDLFGKCCNHSIDALIGLPEVSGTFYYSAVLGDCNTDEFEIQLNQYLKAGFSAFKIKLSGDPARDSAKVRVLTEAGVSPDKVRADANNVWTSLDSAVRHLSELAFPFFAIEEPLGRGDYEGMMKIASALKTSIILDESLTCMSQLNMLAGAPESWILNLRVSKLGGLFRSLCLLDAARRRQLRVIIGAHVGEASVLARTALSLANNARDTLVGQEGAFGNHLLCEDVADPSLMFGADGILNVSSPFGPGLGLSIGNADKFLKPL